MRLISAPAPSSRAALLLVLANLLAQTAALAQSTAFTYQGRLNNNGVPAAGLYDLRFRLFFDALGNNQAGSTLLTNAVPVTNGLFTLTLDFGPGIFNGTNYWLEVDVKTNGAGAYVDLSPLQAVTPVPYAIFAENAVNGGLGAGTYTNAVTLNNPSNNFNGTFIGSGASVSNVNALMLNGLGTGAFWQLGGNNVAGGQFIGSTNNQPVELWANQSRAFRLEPDTNNFGAPNVIGGAPNNFVDPGIFGATIAGGGVVNYTTNGYEPGAGPNHVSAVWGTISGGRRNTVAADHSIVGGGHDNLIQPFAYDSVIGGGSFNTIGNYEEESVIAGGEFNSAGGFASTVSGGYFNNAGSYYTTVGGGYNNLAGVSSATVGGGYQNSADADSAAVGGGVYNRAVGPGSVVSGGIGNFVSGYAAAVSGGLSNSVAAYYATIAGGSGNSIQTDVSYGFIGAGNGNSIAPGSGYSVIAGGITNTIQTNSGFCVLGGGYYNSIGAGNYYASLGGGASNSSSGVAATIAGGYFNSATGNSASVGGGTNNGATGAAATVPGGSANLAGGAYSFAAGQQAYAANDGSFVWADAQNGPFASTGVNQFLVRASGGAGVNTNNPAGAALNVAGTVRAASFQGDGSGLFNVGAGALGNYVFAYNNGSQSVVTGNVFQDIVFATDAQINGWTHTSGTSQYTNAQTGLYLAQYNADVSNPSGTNAQFRVTLNGVEIPGSRAAVTFTALNQSIAVSKSLIAGANAGDVLTIQFTGSSSGIRLIGTANSTLTVSRIQ